MAQDSHQQPGMSSLKKSHQLIDWTCLVKIMQFSRKYANDVIVLNEFPTNHFHLNGTSHSMIG